MPATGNLITLLNVTDAEGPVTVDSANNTPSGVYTQAPGVVNFLGGATFTFSADGAFTFDEGDTDQFLNTDPPKVFTVYVEFEDTAGNLVSGSVDFVVNGVLLPDQPPSVGMPNATVIVNP